MLPFTYPLPAVASCNFSGFPLIVIDVASLLSNDEVLLFKNA